MALHFYTLDQCPAIPWKNGGGTTKEIACWPVDSTMSDFDWRISVADIDMDGPFSVFPGIDRTIMLLNGAGVQLTADDGSFAHTLSSPLAPFHFSGDTSLDCALLEGSTQDFNIMARRGKSHASTRIVRTVTSMNLSETGLLFVASGKWDVHLGADVQNTINAIPMGAGTGFWWHNQPLDLMLTPVSEEAAIIMVQLDALL